MHYDGFSFFTCLITQKGFLWLNGVKKTVNILRAEFRAILFFGHIIIDTSVHVYYPLLPANFVVTNLLQKFCAKVCTIHYMVLCRKGFSHSNF